MGSFSFSPQFSHTSLAALRSELDEAGGKKMASLTCYVMVPFSVDEDGNLPPGEAR
jgi:hypothetical protein